jgi:hypothetical protein
MVTTNEKGRLGQNWWLVMMIVILELVVSVKYCIANGSLDFSSTEVRDWVLI